MGNGHGTAIPQQQLRHGFAHDVGSPNHHRVEARQAAMVIAQHHQTAQRRARHHGFLTRAQKTHIGDMEPVHILFRRNRIDHQILIEVPRQRQLHQNAMHLWIRVQLVNQGEQISLGRVRLQLMLVRVHADLDGLFAFGADIDLAGRIFPHQHHSKARRDAVIGFQAGHMVGHLRAHSGGKSLSVNDGCGHGLSPSHTSVRA